MADMRLHVNFDMKAVQDNVNRMLNKKVAVIHYTETRNDVAGEYAKRIDRYVPMKTGKLRRSVGVDNGAITYSAKVRRKGGNFDYAKVQYYSDDSFWDRTTPDTYSHWNKHLTTAERLAFYEDVAKIIKERMNNDQ